MQERIEPEAYLRSLRNVRRGLRARSRLISAVRNGKSTKGQEISREAGLSYGAAMRHLRNMKAERIVEKNKSGWRLTGLGQRAVSEYLRRA